MHRRKVLLICLCSISLVVIAGGYWRYKSSREFELEMASVAPKQYPSVLGSGLLWYSKRRALRVPGGFPISGRWTAKSESSILSMHGYFPMPKGINLLWLSVSEYKSYYLAADLDRSRMEELWKSNVDADGHYLFSHLVVGMAPYGGVALWMSGHKKAILVDWMHGMEAPEVVDRFIPKNVDMTLKEYCNSYTPENLERESYRQMRMDYDHIEETEWKQPPVGIYDGYMEQFRYRYVLRFENWEADGSADSEVVSGLWREPSEGEWRDSVELSFLWEHLFDGTYDQLHDGRLFTYHTAGKPRKLHVEWKMGGTDYLVFFLMDDQIFTEAFNDFCGADHDTDTDIIIRIDPNKFKFEFSLYRYGLEHPVTIPEDAYQFIVFEGDTSCFRSNNYSMNRGEWLWCYRG